jgi:PTS system beta-glucosides-specific IIC component
MGYSSILAIPIFEHTILAIVFGILAAVVVAFIVTFIVGFEDIKN